MKAIMETKRNRPQGISQVQGSLGSCGWETLNLIEIFLDPKQFQVFAFQKGACTSDLLFRMQFRLTEGAVR